MRTRIAGGSVFRTFSVLNGVNPHKINAANPRKRACSGVFGTPGETQTHFLTLRRRTLCLGELWGAYAKTIQFPGSTGNEPNAA